MSNAKFEAYENPPALHQCDERCDTRIFETRLPRNQSDGHERKIRQGGTQNRLWTACKDDRIIVISSYLPQIDIVFAPEGSGSAGPYTR